MAWLREITWPVDAAIFDSEVVAGDGNEGIQAVFHERQRPGGAMAVILFDVLSLDGQNVMREPRTARRKRLESVVEAQEVPGVRVVPYTDDAPGLWDAWVGMGGEGIVLKDRDSIYRPGVRSPAWLNRPSRSSASSPWSRWSRAW